MGNGENCAYLGDLRTVTEVAPADCWARHMAGVQETCVPLIFSALLPLCGLQVRMKSGELATGGHGESLILL